MALSKILEEINVLKPIAEMDLNNGPRETYSGREGQKRNAKERLIELKERYIEDLRFSTVFVLVSGSSKDQFAEISKNEFKCFVADPEGFYKDLVERLPPELFKQKTPPANLFDIMGRHFEDKALEMKIIGYPQMIFHAKYQKSCKSKEDFKNIIKEAINDQVGSEISGLHVVRSLTDDAIKMGHKGPITPIILPTDDELFAIDLSKTSKRIGCRAFLVAAGKDAKIIRKTEGAFAIKEVTNESVENILKNIRNLCK